MTDAQTNADLAPTEEYVREWLESEMGVVTNLQRQARWRPVWFADVERDGRTQSVCVRGPRVDLEPMFPLNHEMQFHRCLEDAGLPVARVFGSSDTPNFYVMEKVPGVFEFDGSTEAEKRSVVDQYLQALARMHRLDTTPFVEAGITRAADPTLSWQPGMEAFERTYRVSKVRPDPLMEWGLGWIWRNPPAHPEGRESPVVWDSGQFLHVDGQLTAIMDIELGHLGDPMMDLAGWRMRDTIIKYGDFTELYARYEEHGGVPIDWDAIRWHHFAFSLTNQLAFHRSLADPPLGAAYMTNLQWCTETNVMAVEACAEAEGIELESLPTPPAGDSPAAAAYGHLVASLRHFPATDEISTYEARMAFRLARHLQRFDQIGHAVTEANLDDLEPLLGYRPGSWAEGEEALEKYVLADGGAHDTELLQLFNRRTQRAQMLLGPEGSAMVKHHKVQPLPPRVVAR